MEGMNRFDGKHQDLASAFHEAGPYKERVTRFAVVFCRYKEKDNFRDGK